MTAKQAQGLMAPDGSYYVTLTDGAGALGSVTVSASDIEIGAVEIKNATTDDRVTVSAAGAMKVDNSAVTQPVSGTVTAAQATAASLNATVVGTGTFATQAAATQSGTWTVQPGNTANTTAWKVDGSAVTQPVSLASVPSHAVTNAGTFAVQLPTSPATGTMSSVASSASSVTVLASNASRKGASVYNDSTQILYLAVSATTASSTAYTIQLPANAFFELPPCRDGSIYTGQLTGIWASANGNARVTEWS